MSVAGTGYAEGSAASVFDFDDFEVHSVVGSETADVDSSEMGSGMVSGIGLGLVEL